MPITLPYTKTYNMSSNRQIKSTLTDTIGVDANEEYKTTPLLSCLPTQISYPDGWGGNYTETYTINAVSPTITTHRVALLIDTNVNTPSIIKDSGNNTISFLRTEYNDRLARTWTYTNNATPESISIPSGMTVSQTFATNIPVFETSADANAYLFASTQETALVSLRKALNYKLPVEDIEGDEFEITNPWQHGTWTQYGVTVTGNMAYRNVRGKMATGGKVAFYKIEGIDSGALKYGVKISAEFSGLQYSVDGLNWQNVDSFPFTFFYRQRERELGEFDFGYGFNFDYFPVWDSEEDADDYIDGTKPITDAPNYPQISPHYPITNDTGDDDDGTTMGEVYTRAFFSQQYICSESALQEISNALFDTSSGGIIGKFEDIKKGLEMYGDSVIDAVQGCMYFPVNLTQVFAQNQSQNYIYFGGYKFDLQNSTVNKIIYPNGYYDFGGFDILPTFSNSSQESYRDFAPYQRLFVFLPYIGWQELDIARYIGKHVSVRYYFDTRTGGCLACLFVGSGNTPLLVDYFSGQCGVSMPITLTDFSNYANSQIQTLLTFGNGQGQNASNVANMASGLAKEGVGASAIATASVGLLGVGGAIGATKALYGLTQNNINNFNKTKGASTSMLNMYLPQEVCFMLETQDADETANEMSLQGYPSNASGAVNSFNGYLEVDTINLVCANATDNEKKEIISMLQNGVYI